MHWSQPRRWPRLPPRGPADAEPPVTHPAAAGRPRGPRRRGLFFEGWQGPRGPQQQSQPLCRRRRHRRRRPRRAWTPTRKARCASAPKTVPRPQAPAPPSPTFRAIRRQRGVRRRIGRGRATATPARRRAAAEPRPWRMRSRPSPRRGSGTTAASGRSTAASLPRACPPPPGFAAGTCGRPQTSLHLDAMIAASAAPREGAGADAWHRPTASRVGTPCLQVADRRPARAQPAA
mmetsp:Transcript_8834/g.26759  ORF Transcript_8834/g.26759 Transcript_8834/m.26759 type:complete len:233 (+) Transcript_8834:25-723(+)